jgi:hypothetical protein
MRVEIRHVLTSKNITAAIVTALACSERKMPMAAKAITHGAKPEASVET